jgi:hypothetical protein
VSWPNTRASRSTRRSTSSSAIPRAPGNEGLPRTPWGSCVNICRRNADLSRVTQRQLDRMAAELNERPPQGPRVGFTGGGLCSRTRCCNHRLNPPTSWDTNSETRSERYCCRSSYPVACKCRASWGTAPLVPGPTQAIKISNCRERHRGRGTLRSHYFRACLVPFLFRGRAQYEATSRHITTPRKPRLNRQNERFRR